MLLTLILGLALVVVAVTLVARGLSLSRVRTTETLSQIPAYGFTHPTTEPVQATRPVSGALDGIAGVIGSALARRFGSMQEATVRSELMAAGIYFCRRGSSSATGCSRWSACRSHGCRSASRWQPAHC